MITMSVCIDCRSYALSVRVLDEQTNTYSIKHYRIRKFHDGQVGVSQKKLFNSVVQLVAYYRGQLTSHNVALILPLVLHQECKTIL